MDRNYWGFPSQLLKTCPICRFTGLSGKLPATSAINMFDVWMLASLTLPFVEVALLTYKEHLITTVQQVELFSLDSATN